MCKISNFSVHVLRSLNLEVKDMSVPPPRPQVEMILLDDTPDVTPTTAHLHRTSVSATPWTTAARAAAQRKSSAQAGSNTAAPRSQPLRQKRKIRSCVWTYFTKTQDHEYVKCNAEDCPWKTVFQKGSTSNMRNHLQNAHLSLVCLLLFNFHVCISTMK